MDDRKLRILVIENEYLIAMEAARIIRDSLGFDVVVGTMDDLAYSPGSPRYDVVVLDTAGDGLGNPGGHSNSILARGAGLVFLNAYSDMADGVPGFEDWPVVSKPFDDETLLDAVGIALSRTGRHADL